MFISKEQRIERSLDELEQLRTDCLAWVDLRHKKDTQQQYQTQLNALSELVERACATISRAMPQVSDERGLDETFEHCRFLDQRLAWTRRLWEFFREKFDQRDSSYGPLLRAADEVIWSCYRTPFELLAPFGEISPGASPLPYIEPYLSPAAYPREIFPIGLSAEDRDFRRRFNKLPIPLVRLTPLSLREPWWLIFAAHESGHQVQYDLALVDEFRMALQEAVAASPLGVAAETASLWGEWSREIFADIYSIGAVGGQAALAMADAEFGTPSHLLDRLLDGYPAPLVRLSLLNEAAYRFGLARPLEQALLELKTRVGQLPPELETDLKLVPLVIKTAFTKLQPGGLTLSELIPPYPNFYQPGGLLEAWATQLRFGPRPIIQGNLEAARQLTAAAYKAWNDTLLEANGTLPPTEIRQELAERTLESIRQSRQEGTRASLKEREFDLNFLDDLTALLISPNIQLPPSL